MTQIQTELDLLQSENKFVSVCNDAAVSKYNKHYSTIHLLFAKRGRKLVLMFICVLLSVWWSEGRAGGAAAALRQQPARAICAGAGTAVLQGWAAETVGQEVTGKRSKVNESDALGESAFLVSCAWVLTSVHLKLSLWDVFTCLNLWLILHWLSACRTNAAQG